MNKQFAITQVCEVSLSREEVQQIVVENLLARGADPAYDFATGHPIFVWDERGRLSVRFVQSAVVAREASRFLSLKPMPSRDAVNKLMDEARRKAEIVVVPSPATPQ